MAKDFTIEVPISAKGEVGQGRAGGSKGMDELNKNVKKLDKTMFLNIDVIEILSSLLGDVYKVLRPLFKLLSLILLLIFLPLMPIFKDLIKGLSKLAGVIAKITKPGGAEEFVEEKGKGVSAIIAGILIAAGAVILFALGGWIVALLGVIAAIIIVFWEDIIDWLQQLWENIGIAVSLLWQGIVQAWEWIKGIPKWLWENIIKPSWEFLKDVGSWIWNIISAPFRWLADKIRSIWDFFAGLFGRGGGRKEDDFIWRKGQGAVSINPNDTIVGFKGKAPNLGGGSTVININNPIVRNTSDIKMLANEVSRVLQRQVSGRSSIGAA